MVCGQRCTIFEMRRAPTGAQPPPAPPTEVLMRTLANAVGLVALLPITAAAQAPTSDRALIANALSAAPASVADRATVVTHDGRTLRDGSNGWVCMPDDPAIPNNSPMCLDEVWRDFIDALMNKREPRAAAIGIAYMLQGDMPVSNVDPYATRPTPANQWLDSGPPHIMIIVPDRALLQGLPTDPHNGGPWVMWEDTPYAHIMVPVPPPTTNR
jgi:hypothetical protein